MDQQEQQLIDRIKQAQNVLVTVSVNPSVDQLVAAIGLTIALNKMDKHGTAVFSGQVPSTMEFLKPEETLEKNTDSLRDFIIALDKSKADKLRYKVEDQVVRIFITPYKTSLSDKDLQFSQGDFNVDVVIALGVGDQKDIDAAISAHGRILHDATVASISAGDKSNLGSINWVSPSASSLSEMMLNLIDGLDKKLLDDQIATALLTGIVASTDRFRNEKTSPKAMSASAELMAAGANQQLIATELETPPPQPEPVPEPARVAIQDEGDGGIPPAPGEQIVPTNSEPGALEIDHDDDEKKEPDTSNDHNQEPPTEEEPPKQPEPPQPQINVDEDGTLRPLEDQPLPEISQVHGVKGEGDSANPPEMSEVHHDRITEPPALGDVNMTANASEENEFDPPTEELSLPSVNAPLLKHNESVLSMPPSLAPKQEGSPFIPQAPLQPAPQNWQPPTPPPSVAPVASPLQPAPAFTPPPLPPASPSPMAPPLPPIVPLPAEPSGPLVPMPEPPNNPYSSAPSMPPPSGGLTPDETLSDIEQAVRSPHTQSAADHASGLTDARSAVEAAFNNAAVPQPPQPVVALNAMPLGSELHSSAPQPGIPNAGFSESTPGNTPADATLDMPLPSNPFGPPQQTAPQLPTPPPSTFPGSAPQMGGQDGVLPPPPVPPPMLPPL